MAGRVLHLLNCLVSAAQVHQIQAQIILQCLHSDTAIGHRFIASCESVGLLSSAFILFTQFPNPHIFICNSLLQAFSNSHFPHRSISVFDHIRRNSVLPNNFTFPFLLKSLARLRNLGKGQNIHAHLRKSGHLPDLYIQNSLLGLYASCGCMGLCRQVFDEMPLRDVVSWTTLITGNRNVGMYADALMDFEQMQYAGVAPNRVTVVNVLPICAKLEAIDMGVWIHDWVRREMWEIDVLLGTSLIDMYSKCGKMEEGLGVFHSMKQINVFTWNALIKGFAVANRGGSAIKWFLRMEEQGFGVDEVTLLNVLSACAHAGMVRAGRQVFGSILVGKYNFSANAKHYASMINLFARSGYVEEAFRFITSMPFEPTKATWGALLAGAREHGALEMSVFAVKKLLGMEPENGAYFVLLSNLYAEMRRWEDVEEVRRQMKVLGLNRDSGFSSVKLEFGKYMSHTL